MKTGMIFLPPRFYKRFTDFRKLLFEMIAKEFNFPFNVRNFFGALPKDLDVLIFFSNPHSSKELTDVENIPDKTKVIQFCSDLHSSDVLVNFKKSFKRADRIIGPYAAFREKFPQYIAKFVPFRGCFASDERYTSLSYNKKPIMKCLLTGVAYDADYPLRMVVKNALTTDTELRGLMEVNWHLHPKRPGETAPVYGDEYAKRLNAYFCGVTCSSKHHYTVAKYMQIPAAGSLLLADQTPDSDEAGFIPHKHYVPITADTVVAQIKGVLNNPAKYENVRRRGMKFVRTNHSVKNRFEQFKEIIQQELDNG